LGHGGPFGKQVLGGRGEIGSVSRAIEVEKVFDKLYRIMGAVGGTKSGVCRTGSGIGAGSGWTAYLSTHCF